MTFAAQTQKSGRWQTAPLGEVVDILDSRRVPVNSEERNNRVGDVPYYGATGQVGWIDDSLFDEELVLLGEDGAPFLDSAKPKAYLVRGKSWVNNHAHVLRAKPGLLNSFLLYQLNCTDYRPYVSGTTRLKLPQGPMKQIPLFVPDEDEQRRIVAEIEKQFTRLEAGVAGLRRVQANLKRYRAAVLKAACEGKLVPTEAELARERDKVAAASRRWSSEPNQSRDGSTTQEGRSCESGAQLLERILTERRQAWNRKGTYKEAKSVSDDNLPRVPEGWCYTKLEALLSIQRVGMKTGPFGTLLKKGDHRTDGIAVLGIENIENMKFVRGSKIHITREKASRLVGYGVAPGDILISRSGTVGEVCVVPADLGEAIISTNLLRLSLRDHGMLPVFFCLLFNGSPFVLGQVQELCKGSTRNFLNQHILNSLIFALPPLAEQQRIVAEVERRLSVLEELQAVVNANLLRATRLRQSILRRAFSEC